MLLRTKRPSAWSPARPAVWESKLSDNTKSRESLGGPRLACTAKEHNAQQTLPQSTRVGGWQESPSTQVRSRTFSQISESQIQRIRGSGLPLGSGSQAIRSDGPWHCTAPARK